MAEKASYGEIVLQDSNTKIDGNNITKYLGTSYILNNKADFEPRKNLRLYI